MENDVQEWYPGETEDNEGLEKVLIMGDQFDGVTLMESKKRELENWDKNNVLEPIEDVDQKCVSVCWILSEKVFDDEKEQLKQH